MRILFELRRRFHEVLQRVATQPTDELLAMIRPAQDAKFGDYQANCAMPLGKQLGRPPREIAAELVAGLDLDELCEPPEVAGPGFINLRIRDEWLTRWLNAAFADERLGVSPATNPRTYVIDFSSPNVAKPMHVGHIRSTVIGDAIYRILTFLGHRAIADNHLGDWGTQFGMIIYGYKHFLDRRAYQANPVGELARLYKLVNRLVEYQNDKQQLPELERRAKERRLAVEAQRARTKDETSDQASAKKSARALRKLQAQCSEAEAEVEASRKRQAGVEADPAIREALPDHAHIAQRVLEETAKLHAGDETNRALWQEFLPKCRQEIQRVYDRLRVRFDYEHGESFYHDRLTAVVDAFQQQELARESEGAVCVFLEGFDTPMIIRKQDGAFLYATTDLATIQYRMETWRPDAVLYVVDHRQGEHFEKLFAAARLWGFQDVDLRHISFGTVLGEDGRPYKTRSGDTVGLEGLLDEAVSRAWYAVAESDQQPFTGSPEERQRIANVVGHGAIKYADLSHNRTSDYVFSYDKMLALTGNTATYVQYSYARVRGIFAKGGVDPKSLGGAQLKVSHPAERDLALKLLQFADALDETVEDFRPNQLTSYLYELTKVFFTFFENCPVLKAEDPETRTSRLALCDLTGRTIKQGLNLLGIEVIDRM